MDVAPKKKATDPFIGLLTLDVSEAKGCEGPLYITVHAAEDRLLWKSPFSDKGAEWKKAHWRTLLRASETRFTFFLGVWKDRTLLSDVFLGQAELSVEKFSKINKGTTSWLPIQSEEDKLVGQLGVSVRWREFEEVHSWFWKALITTTYPSDPQNLTKERVRELLESVNCLTPKNELEKLFGDSKTIKEDDLIKFISDNQDKVMGTFADPLHEPTDFIWNTSVLATRDQLTTMVVDTIVSGDGKVIAKDKVPTEDYEDDIFVQDRLTGKIIKEKIPGYIKTSLKLLYANAAGRATTASDTGKKTLIQLSEKQGEKADSPASAKDIPDFIKLHNLDLGVIRDPIDSFKTFNEFFYRHYDLSQRPIDADEFTAVSPADCRLHVFENLESAVELWIKGKGFTLSSLLENKDLEKLYEGCSVVIARLAPQDYHRYHFPVNGKLGNFFSQGDSLYTVNPIAIRGSIDVFSLNKRISVQIDSPEFGKVMYISVGATMVGSVQLTSKEGSTIKKGDEHGYFAFGGSTILLLFEKDRIIFDQDLVLNSSKKMETLVQMGMRMGVAPKRP